LNRRKKRFLAYAGDVAAAGGDDGVEQLPVGVAAVVHIAAIRLQGPPERLDLALGAGLARPGQFGFMRARIVDLLRPRQQRSKG